MKNRHSPRRRAFTLIELLTVIAVLGILVSILVPTVGAARNAANKAKSKAQYVGYANALQAFKAKYGYWPTFFTGENAYSLNGANTQIFVETLSGRDENGDPVVEGGNRQAAPFYSFAEDEYQEGTDQLADAFNNPNITIFVDYDNDGKIDGLPTEATGSATARVKVAIYSDTDPYPSGKPVYTWE